MIVKSCCEFLLALPSVRTWVISAPEPSASGSAAGWAGPAPQNAPPALIGGPAVDAHCRPGAAALPHSRSYMGLPGQCLGELGKVARGAAAKAATRTGVLCVHGRLPVARRTRPSGPCSGGASRRLSVPMPCTASHQEAPLRFEVTSSRPKHERPHPAHAGRGLYLRYGRGGEPRTLRS